MKLARETPLAEVQTFMNGNHEFQLAIEYDLAKTLKFTISVCLVSSKAFK